MMLFISAEVLLRNVFNASIPGNYEIVQNYFMPIVTFPILVYAYSTGILPRVHMVVVKFSEKVQKVVLFILIVIELVLFTLIFIHSLQYSLSAVAQGMSFPASGSLYPLYPVLFLVPFGFGLLIIELLFIFVKNVREKEVSFTMFEQKEEYL